MNSTKRSIGIGLAWSSLVFTIQALAGYALSAFTASQWSSDEITEFDENGEIVSEAGVHPNAEIADFISSRLTEILIIISIIVAYKLVRKALRGLSQQPKQYAHAAAAVMAGGWVVSSGAYLVVSVIHLDLPLSLIFNFATSPLMLLPTIVISIFIYIGTWFLVHRNANQEKEELFS